MATALASTITIVKGKKVVSTSKHFVGLYKEAKTAYLEKKAELKTAREEEFQQRLLAIRGADDAASHLDIPVQSKDVSREGSRERTSASPGVIQRHTMERMHSDNARASERFQNQISGHYVNGLFVEQESELARSYSSPEVTTYRNGAPAYTAAYSTNPDWMDLAYGDMPPPLPVRRVGDEDQLRMKMTTLNRMLEEANCMQYSAKAIIKSLETNPDAMAAVALTLAEISNLARKMAPGALTAFKGSFPAIIALLASPEFLVAVGVGVGLTVVALGGYKIIKRIQAKKEGEAQTDELEEFTGDLDDIETWRRGISDADAQSMGTSVEGEFITPKASQQLKDQGKPPSKNTKSSKTSKASKKAKELKLLTNGEADVNNTQFLGREKDSSVLRKLFKKS